MKRSQYKQFAFGLLFYTMIIILWGAWVRISHSGDGCGDTWPLCNGVLIPEELRGKTWVEYGHRLTSGIYGFLAIYFYWAARKLYDKKHPARFWALLTLIFTISEALLGAKLVLFGLVTTNDTPYRAFVIALHLFNSFLLTGSVALTFASSLQKEELQAPTKKDKAYRLLPLILLVIGITGAWAALSNSLFPSKDLWLGFLADLSVDSHFLIRLRGLHPVMAVLGGGGLALFFWIKAQTSEVFLISRRSYQMSLTLIAGIIFGFLTLILHAPVWMKMVHLALAHTIWVLLLQWIYFHRTQKEQ